MTQLGSYTVISVALYLFQKAHPDSGQGGTVQRQEILGGMAHWGPSLETCNRHQIIWVSIILSFKISFPLGSQKINREAVLGQSENQWSYSRVRRGKPEFSEVHRAEGDLKEAKMIKKDVWSTSEYARAEVN